MGAGDGRQVVSGITQLGTWVAPNIVGTAGEAAIALTGAIGDQAVSPDNGLFFGLTFTLSTLVTGGNFSVRPTLQGIAWGPVTLITAASGVQGFIDLRVVGGTPTNWLQGSRYGILVGSTGLLPAGSLDAIITLWGTLNRGRLPG